jgi:quinol monooxygenase YgiN
MPIYQLAHYQIKPEGVEDVKKAIAQFVDYVENNEPGCRLYAAWQHEGDPTMFTHIFIFEDEEAHERHGRSDAVARFEAIYQPVLAGGPVDFVDYRLIADNAGRCR